MFDTAANIINDAAKQLGLVSSSVSDPFASVDPAVLQLNAHLKAVGRKLVKAHGWSQLQKTHTLPWVASTASYSLPTDFDRLLDETMWNRTGQVPVPPVGPGTWQLLKAMTSSGVVWPLVRIYGNLLYFHPTPSSTDTIAFEYISNYWVTASGQTAPNKTEPTVTTDTIWFESTMVVDALKYAWETAKGFASQGSLDEYIAGLRLSKSADGAAPVLTLGGGSGYMSRFVDDANVPDTGVGS